MRMSNLLLSILLFGYLSEVGTLAIDQNEPVASSYHSILKDENPLEGLSPVPNVTTDSSNEGIVSDIEVKASDTVTSAEENEVLSSSDESKVLSNEQMDTVDSREIYGDNAMENSISTASESFSTRRTVTYGNLTVQYGAHTIEETIPNKSYSLMTITLEVPDNTVEGKEWELRTLRLYYWLYRTAQGAVPIFEKDWVQFDMMATTIRDETGADASQYFTVDSKGEIRLIRDPNSSISSEFYGHTYTFEFFGSIKTPHEYNELIVGDYLQFPEIAVQFNTTQLGYNEINVNGPLNSSEVLRFRVFKVTANYLDEDGTVLADPVVYGGYSGDSYKTTEKEIDGYHLIEQPDNAEGDFQQDPIVVNYIYRKDMWDIDVRDSTLYVGDNWNPKDNFVSARDRYGNPIEFSEEMVNGSVDTETPGLYSVTYTNGPVNKEVTITVKEDQTSIVAKDSTLNIGESWNPEDNFVSATDRDGNDLDFDLSMVSGSVDTSTIGEYQVIYTNGNASQEITVKVTADGLVAIPGLFDFGSTNSLTDSNENFELINKEAINQNGTVLFGVDTNVWRLMLSPTDLVNTSNQSKKIVGARIVFKGNFEQHGGLGKQETKDYSVVLNAGWNISLAGTDTDFDKGPGVYALDIDPESVKLVIPTNAERVAGEQYSASLTWVLNQVP